MTMTTKSYASSMSRRLMGQDEHHQDVSAYTFGFGDEDAGVRVDSHSIWQRTTQRFPAYATFALPESNGDFKSLYFSHTSSTYIALSRQLRRRTRQMTRLPVFIYVTYSYLHAAAWERVSSQPGLKPETPLRKNVG